MRGYPRCWRSASRSAASASRPRPRQADRIWQADHEIRLHKHRSSTRRHSGCSRVVVPFQQAPRLKAFDYLGIQRYFLTICTHDRREIFTEAAAVRHGTAQLLQTSEVERFAIIAYCFMPDHLHFLAEGTAPSSNLKELLRLYKQGSSFAWKRRTGCTMWQRGSGPILSAVLFAASAPHRHQPPPGIPGSSRRRCPG